MTYDQTHWIPVQQRRPLPTFYYHEHFIEMLDFVGRHYAHALLKQHVDFINDFNRLPDNAQRLYVRLVNRKGRLFASNRLRGDAPAADQFYERYGTCLAPDDIARAVVYALEQPPHVVVSKLVVMPNQAV